MGLRAKLSAWLSGSTGGEAAAGPVKVLLEGRMTEVTKAQFHELEEGARVGSVRKSVDSTSAFQGVPAYWFARAIEVGGQETLFEPYRNSVWVQRAIKKVAGPVASVQVVFLNTRGGEASAMKRKMANGKGQMAKAGGMGMHRGESISEWSGAQRVWTRKAMRKAAEEDFVELPDLAEWLEEPAPGLAWSDFVEATVGWIKLRGESFWLLSDEMLVPFPEVRKSLPPIVVARPDRMREAVEDGHLVGWVYTDPSGRSFKLLPEQVIQTKFWNPYNPWRGLAEYDAAQIASEGDWLAGKFSRNIMANNGDTGPFIVAKNGVPSDPQREQIIADLKAKRQAQLRGDFRPIFMTGDIVVQDPKVQTVDANFVGMRLEGRHEVAAAFGVPMSMFDVKNDYSMGSQSAYYQLILDTCIPMGAKLCDGLERLVQRLKGERYEIGLLWDEHPVLQTVRRERFDAMEKLCNRGMPVKDASDYLHLDLPRFEGDEVGYLPISLTPAGEVEAEPEPATNPALAEEPDLTGENGEEPEAVKALRKAFQERMANGKSQRAKGLRAGARQRLWEKHMRMRSGTVRAFQSKVSRVLNDFRAKALSRMSAVASASKKGLVDVYGPEGVVQKSLIDLIFDPVQFGKELVVAINPLQQAALETAGTQLMSEIGRVDPWKFPPEQALEFSRRREQAVQGCGATVRAQLNTALSEGYEAGETTDQLADRVRGVFNSLSKGEAERIARTETSAAFGFARDTAMKAAGIQYKEWLTSGGPNVREDHLEAEGQRVPIDEPFHVGGEDLMYPGDESGSPGNTINCQCVQVAVEGPEK